MQSLMPGVCSVSQTVMYTSAWNPCPQVTWAPELHDWRGAAPGLDAIVAEVLSGGYDCLCVGEGAKVPPAHASRLQGQHRFYSSSPDNRTMSASEGREMTRLVSDDGRARGWGFGVDLLAPWQA